MAHDKRRVEVHELVRIVADDLTFLRDLDFAGARRTEVRIAAGMLRRLLHDGVLWAAWKALRLPDRPEFEAIDLASMIGDVPRKYIHYAYAGGARLPGAHHTGYVLLSIPAAEAEQMGGEAEASKEIQRLIRPGDTKTFTLDEFIVSPCVVTGEAAVSRLELVRYVSNKLGGVHLDAGRASWTDPLGSRYRFLDEVHLKVGRFPASYYEVISIADSVARSTSTDRLIRTADEKFPEEQAPDNVLSFREGRAGGYADMTFDNPTAAESEGHVTEPE